MLIGDIIIAMILGFLFAMVFGAVFRSRELPGIIPLFTLFFLFAWVGGLWLRPVGPPIFGIYWAQGLILVVLVFLLLAATLRRPSRTQEEAKQNLAAQGKANAAGVTFWILIAVLLTAVLIGYLL